MAPKKKKKPASNPARGVATTSMPSKAKVQEAEAEAAAPPVVEVKEVEVPEPNKSTISGIMQPPAANNYYDPEAYARELEDYDLQQFFEKHQANIHRAAQRTVLRLETDKRQLRTGGLPELKTGKLATDGIIDEILELGKETTITRKVGEDELVLALWEMYSTLTSLGYDEKQAERVVNEGITEVEEALMWLGINCAEELPPFRELGKKEKQGFTPTVLQQVSTSAAPAPAQPVQSTAEALAQLSDTSSNSETDDDVEPGDMVSLYLKYMKRITRISKRLPPDMIPPPAPKGKNPKKQLPNPLNSLPNVDKLNTPLAKRMRKLRTRLNKISRDVLFDQELAHSMWAEYLKVQAIEAPRVKKAKAKEEIPETPDDSESDFEAIGDIFELPTGVEVITGSTSERLTIRDFGRGGEASPFSKKILMETIVNLHGKTRVSFQDVSGVSANYRSQLNIDWFHQARPVLPEDEDGAFTIRSTRIKGRVTTVFKMATVACPTNTQAENHISTIALYKLYPDSKYHLRLNNVWKTVWAEFVEETRIARDIAEKNTLKWIRESVDTLPQTEIAGMTLRQTGNAIDAPEDTTPIFSEKPVNERIQQEWYTKQNNHSYQMMLDGRMNLPMWSFKEQVLRAIHDEPIVIICGETGCGKSTQVPAFILEDQMSKGKACKIYCTEPRRISAISLARRVSSEMGERPSELGTNNSLIGYAIRLESKVSSTTRLIYATTGIVMRMLERSNGLDDITHLVLDEVHERSIESDFLLIVLRKLMQKRSDLKVILMSATVDADKFSRYLDGAPVLNVPGRTFPVRTLFLEDAVEMTGFEVNEDDRRRTEDKTVDDNDDDEEHEAKVEAVLDGYSPNTRRTMKVYDEWTINYDLIVQLLLQVSQHPDLVDYSKAILIFLPGLAEIRKLNDHLLGHPHFHGFNSSRHDRKWIIYPLHSTIASEDQEAAFLIPPEGTRKIVLATNIAETGITIPDITCVIDTGKHKEMRFDEKKQLSRLIGTFVSKANAKQRRGRAGRVQNGLCFHLFTKQRHDTWMAEQQTPEMLRLSLQDLVLRIKICKLGGIEETLSQALDSPGSKNIRRAMDSLMEVKALTAQEELTPLGRQLAKLPLDVYLGKLLLLGCLHGCIDATVTIAAALSSKSPFFTPFGQRLEAEAARQTFKRGDSDLLTTWNAYKSWRKVYTGKTVGEQDYCRKMFLSSRNLASIEDLKQQLFVSLVDANFMTLNGEQRHSLNQARFASYNRRHFFTVPAELDKYSFSDAVVNSITAAAFYPKILAKENNGWRNIVNNQKIGVHPSSVNKKTDRNVSWLSYYNIMQVNKVYNAHETSAVEDLAIALLCGDAEIKLFAGAMIIDGHRIRFTMDSWKASIAIKILRSRLRDITLRAWKSPGREMTELDAKWRDIATKVLLSTEKKS